MSDQASKMDGNIPPALKHFIDHYIESVPQLEALLLLRRDPGREWTAAEIAKELYIPESAAASLLADFTRRGFAAPSAPAGRYVYRPQDAEFHRLIEELGSLYAERRVAIISLIYSKPLNKVQTFADAFRFGKENPQ